MERQTKDLLMQKVYIQRYLGKKFMEMVTKTESKNVFSGNFTYRKDHQIIFTNAF